MSGVVSLILLSAASFADGFDILHIPVLVIGAIAVLLSIHGFRHSKNLPGKTLCAVALLMGLASATLSGASLLGYTMPA